MRPAAVCTVPPDVHAELVTTPVPPPPPPPPPLVDTLNGVDGLVVVSPMMYLALSYDHRIIDGKDAVQFHVAVKESLEDPSRLLLQI